MKTDTKNNSINNAKLYYLIPPNTQKPDDVLSQLLISRKNSKSVAILSTTANFTNEITKNLG